MQREEFNASELCSRKLWQLVSCECGGDLPDRHLRQAIEELAARRHYLAELARSGKLGANSNNH